jgi:hypothetical protein
LAHLPWQTKRKFDGTQNSSIIKFGRDWDNDREHGITKGRISLTKDEVESTFNEVIPRIVNSCSNLLSGRKVEVRDGSTNRLAFAECVWYLISTSCLSEVSVNLPISENNSRIHLEAKESKWSLLTSPLRKPLRMYRLSRHLSPFLIYEHSEGAAIWHIKQLVVARAVRSTFGIIIWRPFDAKNPVHNGRKHKSYVDDEYVQFNEVISDVLMDVYSGVNKITGFFDTWIKKVLQDMCHTSMDLVNASR